MCLVHNDEQVSYVRYMCERVTPPRPGVHEPSLKLSAARGPLKTTLARKVVIAETAWKKKLLCFCQIPISRARLPSTLVPIGWVPPLPSGPIATPFGSATVQFELRQGDVSPQRAIAEPPSHANSLLSMASRRCEPPAKMALPSRCVKRLATIRTPSVPVSEMAACRGSAQSPPLGSPWGEKLVLAASRSVRPLRVRSRTCSTYAAHTMHIGECILANACIVYEAAERQVPHLQHTMHVSLLSYGTAIVR